MFETSSSSSNSQRAQGRLQWVLLGIGGLFFFAGVLVAVGVPATPFGGLDDGGPASPTPEVDATQTAEPTTAEGDEPTTQQSPNESTTATTTAEQTTTSTPASGTNQTNDTTNASAQIAYRINVGGPNVSAADTGPAWEADTENNPSPYLNARESDTVVQSTPDNITTEGNVPPGVSNAVFKTYRFERAGDGQQTEEMVWRFPVEQNRDYEVRLYFLEAYFTVDDSGRDYEEPYSEGGPRTFGVEINGEQVLSNYEPFIEHGHDVGAMKSFEVTAEDGMIEIRFLREAENPTVSGIEIVETDN